MSKFVMGIALGTAIGFVVSRMQEQGFFEEMYDNLNDFAAKTKKKAQNMMDQGANELEYAKDRLEHKAKEGKEKLEEMNN